MSTARNHAKRSHRSERAHYTALHNMQQFTPRDSVYRGVSYRTLQKAGAGDHRMGKKNRLVAVVRGKLARHLGRNGGQGE